MIRRHTPLLLGLLMLLSACGSAPTPTPIATSTPNASGLRLPAPEALLFAGNGGAVRISATCWDQDLSACPWSPGLGVPAPADAPSFQLRVVDAVPDTVTLTWRTDSTVAAPSPMSSTAGANTGVITTRVEGDAVILDELPPLPATLRFETAWAVPGVTTRSAVFFFRLLPGN